MDCCITDMRNKEVICAGNGCRLGYISDVEIDTCSGCVKAVIIWGKSKYLGLFGREEDIRIAWKDIEVIGEDTVIVCGEFRSSPGRKRFEGLFKL